MINKYGFIYLWYDVKHQRYYIGSHWGTETDGYICSSNWMRDAYNRRPQDFRRRILKRIYTNKQDMLDEEYRWLCMIKPQEIKLKYYNLKINRDNQWHSREWDRLSIGQKISIKKTGKSTGPCSPEKARRISEAQRASYQSKREQGLPTRKSSKGYKRKPNSEETKRKQSETMKKKYSLQEHHLKGRSRSVEAISKAAEAHRGMKRSETTKQNISIANSKQYKITFANGETITISGLKKYAQENNIPYISLHKSYSNKTPLNKYSISSIV